MMQLETKLFYYFIINDTRMLQGLNKSLLSANGEWKQTASEQAQPSFYGQGSSVS